MLHLRSDYCTCFTCFNGCIAWSASTCVTCLTSCCLCFAPLLVVLNLLYLVLSTYCYARWFASTCVTSCCRCFTRMPVAVYSLHLLHLILSMCYAFANYHLSVLPSVRLSMDVLRACSLPSACSTCVGCFCEGLTHPRARIYLRCAFHLFPPVFSAHAG